jgi:PAS domain S-box-containing protein
MNKSQFFEHYFNNAEVNSILILDCDGKILDINRSFTNNFGYSLEDIKGKNFSILFNEQDISEGKPQLELKQVAIKGQAHDENYIIDKTGKQIWCTGEAILVSNDDGEKYIVKDIVNLQAKKQLHLFLMETEDLLERIFQSSQNVPILILDGSLKVQKVNEAFQDFFKIKELPLTGSSLSNIPHPFWNSPEIKKEVSNMIISNQPLKGKVFLLHEEPKNRKVQLHAKIIEKHSGDGRQIFLIIEDLSAAQPQ